MKKRKLLYISLVLLLVGCAKEADLSNTQSGEGKTPLLINATLSTGRAQTRASGKDFVSGDELIAYIRHVTGGDAINNYTYVSDVTDYTNKLVTFTKGSAAMTTTGNDNIHQTSDLTSNAYWDDFSNPASDATNIRTSGHGLQPYYGYCYNGGTPSTDLVQTTGVLGWTVQTDQRTAEAVQHSDLLWSPTQTKVAYSHEDAHSADHGTLEIPYTHAMSQITVTVIAADGFIGSTDGSSKPLNNTTLTLNRMNKVTTLNTVTTTSFSPSIQTTEGNIASIQMYGETYTTAGATSNFTRRNYTAIVAPGTKLKEGVKLLDVVNADGNNYTLDITSAMLVNDTGWGKDHAAPKQGEEDDKKYVITQPGYNYHLDLTINKSAVQAHATLTGWTDVTASGTGEIVLIDDDTNLLILDDTQVPEAQRNVLVVGVDKNTFENNSTFSLFRIPHTGSYTSEGNRTNSDYVFATVSTFQNNDNPANDQWNNDPPIYWPNITDNYYFRALAKFNSSTGSAPNIVNNISSVGTYNTDKGTAVSQGTEAAKDILWGTTPKHKGYSETVYARSAAIPPRKGGVPIAFEHAMSKVSFNLTTTNDAEVLATNAKVDLTNAKVAVINLHTTGTISIESGTITGGGINSNEAGESSAIPNHTYPGSPISNLFVIPQDFSNGNAKVVVTLANGAIYSVPLKDCKASVTGGGYTANDNISSWIRGKNYTYTIHIEKEGVLTHVLVKDWDAVAGSGTATLDW